MQHIFTFSLFTNSFVYLVYIALNGNKNFPQSVKFPMLFRYYKIHKQCKLFIIAIYYFCCILLSQFYSIYIFLINSNFYNFIVFLFLLNIVVGLTIHLSFHLYNSLKMTKLKKQNRLMVCRGQRWGLRCGYIKRYHEGYLW